MVGRRISRSNGVCRRVGRGQIFFAEPCKLRVCYGEHAGWLFADGGQRGLRFGHPVKRDILRFADKADAAARAVREILRAQHQLCAPPEHAVLHRLEARDERPGLAAQRQRE